MPFRTQKLRRSRGMLKKLVRLVRRRPGSLLSMGAPRASLFMPTGRPWGCQRREFQFASVRQSREAEEVCELCFGPWFYDTTHDASFLPEAHNKGGDGFGATHVEPMVHTGAIFTVPKESHGIHNGRNSTSSRTHLLSGQVTSARLIICFEEC